MPPRTGRFWTSATRNHRSARGERRRTAGDPAAHDDDVELAAVDRLVGQATETSPPRSWRRARTVDRKIVSRWSGRSRRIGRRTQ
ncbi:hypothetical protein [Gordonia spumicola]|uniref:hypothetical protein n=1 Tax=Gordonia spumicola TaxID=589161 RepID=UPI001379B405|nr:hypothetical protein [Gordonia spumicola]